MAASLTSQSETAIILETHSSSLMSIKTECMTKVVRFATLRDIK